MQYIPTRRDYRRSLAYATVVAAIAFLFVPFPLSSSAWIIVELVILVVYFSFLMLKYLGLKENGFDERGVYRRNRLLFTWTQVSSIGLDFRKGGGSVTLVAWPTWAAVLSGPLEQRMTFVDYGVSIVFELSDGKTVRIRSNLDRLTDDSVVERIDELAKSANPRIKFT